MPYIEPSPDQLSYMKRLAFRLARLRKSAAVDADDLISAATLQWWQFCIRHDELTDPAQADVVFRQQIKFAMRDALRSAEPVKITRTDRAKLQAYEMPYAVQLDSTIDLRAGEEPIDRELLLDVESAVRELAPRDQLILSLSVQQGYSFTEIAYVLDVAVSTVTRAYHSALAELKKNLADTQNTRKKSIDSTDI